MKSIKETVCIQVQRNLTSGLYEVQRARPRARWTDREWEVLSSFQTEPEAEDFARSLMKNRTEKKEKTKKVVYRSTRLTLPRGVRGKLFVGIV